MDSNYENMNLFDFIRLCFNKIVLLFKWIFDLILRVIHLCFRYWYVMILCVVLGFFAGKMWTKPRFTMYHGKATITFAPGMKPLIEEGLLSYITLPENVKYEMLGIPYEVQKAVRGIFTYNVIDSKNDLNIDYIDTDCKIGYSDTASTIMPDRITLEIKLFGNNDFYALQRGLTTWFESQEYFTTPDKHYKAALNEKLEYLTHEIERTDSFMDYKYFSEAPKVEIYNDLEIEQQITPLLYKDLMKLVKEKQFVESQVAENTSVINFKTYFYVDSMLFRDKYIIGTCSGFVFGILLSLLIKYWANVKKFLLTK